MPINPNAKIVAQELSSLGLTKAQIAGVLGNLQQESSFNSRVNEGGFVGSPRGEGGFGLAQWTGNRQSALVNFAKQRKVDPGSPNLQAQFMAHELRGPESRSLASLKKAQSPEQAALVFRTDYERAGVPKDEKRQLAARQLYGGLSFLDQPTQTPSAPVSQSPVAGPTVSEILAPLFGGQPNAKIENRKNIANTLLDSLKGSIIERAINPFGLFSIPGLK